MKLYNENDYNNLPDNTRAELIDGFIYYPKEPNLIHTKVLMEISEVVSSFFNNQKVLTKVYTDTFTLKVNINENINIFKPLISVICDYVNYPHRKNSAPDWIIELVSIDNTRNFYVTKLYNYFTAGVREYWIVNPMASSIMVYYFEDINFIPIIYTFMDKVKVNILADSYISLSNIGKYDEK